MRLGVLGLGTLALAALAGCGGEPGGGGTGAVGEAGSGRDRGDAYGGAGAAEAPISRHTGLFTMAEGWTFTPCGGSPVAIDGPAAPELLDIYRDFVPPGTPDRAIFLDVLGRYRTDGREWLDALDLRRVYNEGLDCERDVTGILLEGSGTEPFWNALVEEEVISWSTPEGVRRFEHDGLEWSDRGSRVTSGEEVGTGTLLQIEAWEEPCRDAMSGAWYHMVMEATLGGTRYLGCAYLGVEVESAGPW